MQDDGHGVCVPACARATGGLLPTLASFGLGWPRYSSGNRPAAQTRNHQRLSGVIRNGKTFNSLPFPSIPIPRTLIFAFSQREGTLTPLHPSREPLRLGRPSEVRRSGKLLIRFRLVPFRSVSCRLRGAWDARFLPSRERRGVFAYTTYVTNVRAGAAMAQWAVVAGRRGLGRVGLR